MSPERVVGYTVTCAREGWTVAGRGNAAGGKSGLHRAGCWVTPRGGNPTDQCHRKQTAVRKGGKGETVREELTSGAGDRVGSANPTRSKAESERYRGARPR